jgi:hypothetical protein
MVLRAITTTATAAAVVLQLARRINDKDTCDVFTLNTPVKSADACHNEQTLGAFTHHTDQRCRHILIDADWQSIGSGLAVHLLTRASL